MKTFQLSTHLKNEIDGIGPGKASVLGNYIYFLWR